MKKFKCLAVEWLAIAAILLLLLCVARYFHDHDTGVSKGVILYTANAINAVVSFCLDVAYACGLPRMRPLSENCEPVVEFEVDSLLVFSGFLVSVGCVTYECWRRWFRWRSS